MGRGPNDGLHRRIRKLESERDTLRAEAAALRALLRESLSKLQPLAQHLLDPPPPNSPLLGLIRRIEAALEVNDG